jgi:Bacterial transcriptional activator domain
MKRTLVLALLTLTVMIVATASAAFAGPATAVTKCTAEQGQALIDAGRYEQAINEFSCLVDAHPTEVEGYRGRMEAKALLGRYSDALAENARITAYVKPAHPDAESTILAGYANRLASDPQSIPALTGVTFARWAFYDYPQAIQFANRLLEVAPNNLSGTLLRGSSLVLKGITRGVADLDRAIGLAPTNPHVRFVLADAYTYGIPDGQRAVAEASLALDWGLGTPRVHAILATWHNAFGEIHEAALDVQAHIDQVTTELVTTPFLGTGQDLELDLVPGRTYDIPVPVVAGQTIRIATSSKDFWDSIALLVSPTGEPVVGSDDDSAYFAAFDYVAEETGTYRVLVTSFEAINTGVLSVSRD